MITVIVCFFCGVLAGAVGQDADEYASRLRVSVQPDEPYLNLYAEWEAKPRMGGARYEVSMCEKGSTCSTYGVHGTNIRFDSYRYPRLSYWNEYMIRIQIADRRASTLWAQKTISTGPGFLPSVENLQVRGMQKSMVVDWAEFSESMQRVIDYFEIEVCHSRVNVCTQKEKVLSNKVEHTITGLTAGVEYNVTVTARKNFNGHEYSSLPVTVQGFPEPPSEKLYPVVRNVKVDVQPKKIDCDLVISYDPPGPPAGENFYGVLIEVFDYRGRRKIESKKTKEEKIVLDGMPFFSDFEIRVHALYDEGNDLVETDSVKLMTNTGVGDIAKPEIVTLMAVNGSSALVRWIHEASKHSEFVYRLTFKDGPTLILRDAENYFTLVENLEADRTYLVTMTAFQTVGAKEYSKSSDEKELKMLPKNALIPEISVDRIVGDQLLLNCNVTVPPEEESACSFEISACLTGNDGCSLSRFESKSDLMWITIIPFANYSITAYTKCVFFDLLNVSTASEPLPVFTKLMGLAPVSVTRTLSRSTALAVVWEVRSSQKALYNGFRISWIRVGSETVNSREVPGFGVEITDLEPASEYNISVAGYYLYGNETIMGEVASTTAFTEIPDPPPVSELQVAQIPYSSSIEVTWKAPPFSYGPLKYKVDRRCHSEKTRSTWETSYKFKFDAIEKNGTECVVGITATAKNRENQWVGSNVAWNTTHIYLMPRAVNCSVVFVKGHKYRATITAPPKLRDLAALEFRISDSLDRDGERTRNNSIMIESLNHDRIETRRAQLCANDICGASYPCKVDTNTGTPGRVTDLHVALLDETTLHVTWSKPSITNGPINGYEVEIRQDQGQRVKSFHRKATETFLDFHSGLEYTRFNIAVRAFNFDKFVRENDPKIGPAQRCSIETKGTVPRAPERLEVFDTDGQTLLTWRVRPDPAFDVKLYKIVTVDESSRKRSETFSTSNRLKLSSLNPYTEYSVEVSSCLAQDPQRCGRPSTHHLKTDVGHPSEPSVTLLEQNATSILIRWSCPSRRAGPIDGFEFAYARTDSGLSPVKWVSVSGDIRSVVLNDFEPETEYEIHVRAFNKNRSGVALKSPVGILRVKTKGTLGELGTTWIVVLCCSSTSVILAFGYIALRRFKRNPHLDTQNLIPGEARGKSSRNNGDQES